MGEDPSFVISSGWQGLQALSIREVKSHATSALNDTIDCFVYAVIKTWQETKCMLSITFIGDLEIHIALYCKQDFREEKL